MSPAGNYVSQEAFELAMAAYDGQLAAWPVPLQRRSVETTLGETFVIEFGDAGKAPLVLLHGSASNSASWGLDAPVFASEYHCFAVDLPGETGRSTGARPAYEGTAYVEWLGEVMTALGLERPRICGLSLGGWVGLRFAAAEPARVRSLALLAPGGVVPARETFTGSVDETLASEAGMRKMAQAIFHPQPVPPGVTDAFALMHSIYKTRRDDLPPIPEDELRCVTCPVLLIGGAQDALLDMEATEARLGEMLERFSAEIDPNLGHALIGQAEKVSAFLLRN
jgi:pimeloyl-ACP methyl ester carboxylesterase